MKKAGDFGLTGTPRLYWGGATPTQYRLMSEGIPLRLPSAELCVWLVVYLLTPLVVFYKWQVEYGLYASLAILPVLLAATGNYRAAAIPNVLGLKWVWIVCVALIHRNGGTLLNAGSSVFADLMLVVGLSSTDWSPSKSAYLFKWIFAACVLSICIGLAIGIAAPSVFHVSSVLNDLKSGGRLIIYSIATGHSALQILCFTVLVFCTSNVARLPAVIRIAAALVAIGLLVLSRSADVFPAIALILFVYGVERSGLGQRLKNMAYIGVIAVVLVVIVTPSILESMLYFVRIDLLHGNLSKYGHDLTAGRKLLNTILIRYIQAHPLIGVGHEDSVIKFGTQLVMGRQYFYTYALSESELRVPAQYGIPYFLILLAFIFSPLRVLFSKNTTQRIFSVSVVFMALAMMLSDSQFEFAHAMEYFVLVSFVIIASSKSFLGQPEALPERREPSLVRAKAIARR